MAAKAKMLYFEDREKMRTFILMYKDLFVPYSEETIKYEAKVCDYKVRCKGPLGVMWRGHIDEDIKRMMEQGFVIYREGDKFNEMYKKVNLKIFIEPKEFEKLLWIFKKEKIRDGYYRYVCVL